MPLDSKEKFIVLVVGLGDVLVATRVSGRHVMTPADILQCSTTPYSPSLIVPMIPSNVTFVDQEK